MEITHTTQRSIDTRSTDVQPLRLPESLIWFGVPTIVMLLSFHLGIPALENAGLTAYESFIVTSTVPFALMFVAALAGLIIEQNISSLPQLRDALRDRMRFPRLTLKTALIGLGVYVAMALVGGAFTMLGRTVAASGIVPLPDYLPALLDPRVPLDGPTLTAFVGGQLVGNWGIIALFVVNWFFNIAGEELLWRGLILPRHEAAYGRWAWLVHGLLWWSIHLFKWWDLLAVLPIALIISYAAQRSQNNWVPTIVHGLANVLLMVFLTIGVLGV